MKLIFIAQNHRYREYFGTHQIIIAVGLKQLKDQKTGNDNMRYHKHTMR